MSEAVRVSLNTSFFMTLPTPQTRYSRTHREWTAWRDDLGVVAVGATKKEAVSRFRSAYLAQLFPYDATWTRNP